MSGLTHPLHVDIRTLIAAVAALALGLASERACAQAMQQQPAPQKSMIIQVAPAQSQFAPAMPQPSPVQPSLVQPIPQPVPEPPAVAGAAPAENPGLFNEIGKMWKNSTSSLPAMPSLGSWGNWGSTDGLTRLNTLVKGRVACPLAANGAPDCKLASMKLCQTKGYKEGKSFDTDAAQSCSAKVMIPGRKPEPGDCKTENYVTQALCQ
jgi:hypothetical protein